jgi:hypothetical protein
MWEHKTMITFKSCGQEKKILNKKCFKSKTNLKKKAINGTQTRVCHGFE